MQFQLRRSVTRFVLRVRVMSGIENHRDVVMNEHWRLIAVLLLDSNHGTLDKGEWCEIA